MLDLIDRDKLSIVADLGLTCCGDLTTSLKLIDKAKKAGAHAVKFQMLDADELLGDKSVEYTYPTLSDGEKTERMLDMFQKLEMTDAEWFKIKTHCMEQQIELIVTCHVQSAVARVNDLDLNYNKICTWSINHYHMIKALAENGKPLIIDTGTINLVELKELEEFYVANGGGDIIIFYDFHTNNASEFNFSAITLLKSLGYTVGYTPQGRKDWLDFMSLGTGATILEKRLTLNRETPLNGHQKAHTPDEFKAWVEKVNECFLGLGGEVLKATQDDVKMSSKFYKSARLIRTAKKGEIINKNDFIFQRPGKGVNSKQIFRDFDGKTYDQNYQIGDYFEDPNKT